MGEFLFTGAFSGRADNHAGALRQAVLEDPLQPVPFNVRQLAGNPGHRATGHVDQVAARKGNLAGEPGTLVPDRVLGDLHQHGVPGLQRQFNAARLPVQSCRIPVDLTGIQDGVAPASDVHERCFHAGQYVLHFADIDIADQGVLLCFRNKVLGEDTVLQHTDLYSVIALPDHHLPIDRFAPGQELGLSDNLPAATGIPRIPAALTLGLQPGGTLHAGDLV